MIRWILLAVAVVAFANAWGVFSEFVLLAIFALMILNFATFCILFDAPVNRARLRVATLRQQRSPHSFDAARLRMEKMHVIASDRRLGASPLTVLNLATGIAAIWVLIWGIVLRVA